MADIINSDLGKILQIVSEANHQAVYKPATDAYGNYLTKPDQCYMPDLLDISLNLTLPELEPIKECDLNFIPYPIVPPFFIPDDLVGPCENGMGIEMVYTSLNGQSITLPSAEPFTKIEFVGVAPTAIIPTATSQPLPNLVAHIPVTVNEGGQASILAGERYRVSLKVVGTPLDQEDVVTYNGLSYTADQYFYGKTGQVIANFPHSPTNLKLTLDQTRRVTAVYPSYVTVASAFTQTELSGLPFTLNRFVVSVDDTRPIDSDLRFEQVDQYGCQYRLIGELNLNTPCPDGYAFDTQYQSASTESITATNTAGTVTISNTTGNAITSFKHLIPHEVGQPLPMFEMQTAAATSGNLTTGKLYKVIGTSGSYITRDGKNIYAGEYLIGSSSTFESALGATVWRTYQNYVTTVNTDTDTITISDAPTELPVTVSGTSVASTKWLLNRLVVKTASSPSTFLYVKDEDNSCAGKLIGDINIPEITLPCGGNYTIGIGTVTANQFNYQYKDLNQYNATSTNISTTYVANTAALDKYPFNVGYTTSKEQTSMIPTPDPTKKCCLTLDMPILSAYPIIPEILGGVGILITKGYTANNYPAMVITNTGTGGTSSSAPCTNCCLWA